MNAAEARAAAFVDVERELDLTQYVVENTCLHARRSHLRISVHRIAYPEHGASRPLDGVDEGWQDVGDFRGAHARNERDLPELVRRIEHVEQAHYLIGCDAG